MRFLIDAQLPPGLCAWFEELCHEAQHVSLLLSGQAPDADIVAFAEEQGLVLVSKDDDFATRFQARRFRLLWLRCGNITNRAMRVWLDQRWPMIATSLEAGEALIEVR